MRNKHGFTLLNAYEGSLNGDTSFRLLFEWLREQEDYENEYKSDDVDKNYYISKEFVRLKNKLKVGKQYKVTFTVVVQIFMKI